MLQLAPSENNSSHHNNTYDLFFALNNLSPDSMCTTENTRTPPRVTSRVRPSKGIPSVPRVKKNTGAPANYESTATAAIYSLAATLYQL